MRKFMMERGKGKTTALIYTSAATGYPILIGTKANKNYIEQEARNLGLCIPDPICVGDDFRGRHIPFDHVLVDEADLVLDELVHQLVGVGVAALTMTINDVSDVTRNR